MNQLQNFLQIFAILTYFVNIWTLNAYKQKLWLTIFDFFLLQLVQLIINLLLNFKDFSECQILFIGISKIKNLERLKISIVYK